MTPQQLTEYIFAHDLREASAKIYRAATKALLKHFGPTATVQDVDHRLCWDGGARSGTRPVEAELEHVLESSANDLGLCHRARAGDALPSQPVQKDHRHPPGEQAKPSQPKPSCAPALAQHAGRRRALHRRRARITPAWFWLCTFEVFYSPASG